MSAKLLAHARVFGPQAEVSFHSRDIAELMPMSADVAIFSGNSLPFTCNALEQGKKANAGSKPQLAIIVLVHLKCGSNINH
jgi:hypothetical protein